MAILPANKAEAVVRAKLKATEEALREKGFKALREQGLVPLKRL